MAAIFSVSTSAQIVLGGSTLIGEQWTLTLDGVDYVYSTTSTSVDNLGNALATTVRTDTTPNIPASFTIAYSTTTNTLNITKSGGAAFTLQLGIATQTGASSAATVVIKGTPVQDAALERGRGQRICGSNSVGRRRKSPSVEPFDITRSGPCS